MSYSSRDKVCGFCAFILFVTVVIARCNSACSSMRRPFHSTPTLYIHTLGPHTRDTQNQDEYITDDSQTVEDLLTLLLGIMDDLPDMRYREVYIAGGFDHV